VGNVFTSPSGETIANAAMETETGDGVLLLFANYVGDCLNFELARDILDMEDIRVSVVKASDDAASADKEHWKNRRGIAGIFFAYKAAGAVAELAGGSLEESSAVAEKGMREGLQTVRLPFPHLQNPRKDGAGLIKKGRTMRLEN
jgi:dihydroxyacetone kinase